MIYILITLISLLFAWFVYRYEILVSKNSKILKNYNVKLESELEKRTSQLQEQKKQLEDSEYRWKFAVDGNGDGLWDWNVKTSEVYFSKMWKEMLGYSENEIQNSLEEWEKRVHPDDLEQVYKDITDHMEGKTNSYENEHRVLCKNGKYKWVLDRGIVVEKDKDNNALRLIGTHTDIDERKEYEKKIEMQRYKYKKLMENSSSSIVITDMNAKVIEYSNEFAKMLGYSENEEKDIYVYDFEIIHTKEQILENIKNLSDKPIAFESKYITKDKKIIDVSIKIVKIFIEDKAYIYSSMLDISDYNLLLEKTKHQKEEFKTIFKYAQDGIVIIDLDGNFKKVNPAFIKLTSCEKSKLLDSNFYELFSSEHKQKNKEVVNLAITTGKVENFEEILTLGNKRKITTNISISLLPNKESLLLTIKDTTGLKLAEEQNKLASMGEMIGNIAHQWRQPLSVISTASSGMKMKSDYGIEITKEEISYLSENITKQTEYLSKTIDSFTHFLSDEKTLSDIALDKIIDTTLNLTDSLIKANNITVVYTAESNVIINGSINELSEAFINIISNSKDILIEKIKSDQERFIFITVKKLGNNKAEVIFKDSGGGIPDEIINRVFEPYFTLKHKSIGTGLGLTLAEKIIRVRHKGSISIQNQEFIYKGKNYKGACVTINFDMIT